MTKENQAPLVKRAYQLARSGAFANVAEIVNRLAKEGYTRTAIQVYLEEGSIRADLAWVCDEARKR